MKGGLVKASLGHSVRLRRLFRGGGHHVLVVPLDHTVTDGPVAQGGPMSGLLSQVCANGADAVVLHKGDTRQLRPHWLSTTSLIVHLSASTGLALDPDAKVLVTTVAEALRLGADAVSVHVNLGSEHESQQLRDLASVADDCDRWNVPLLAMVYPRGPRIDDPGDADLIAHAVTLAAALGADIVKTACPRSMKDLAEITRSSPIPVLIAGGPVQPDGDALAAHVADVMRAGAAGVATGRNIFQAADPGAMTRRLADVVHAPHHDSTSDENHSWQEPSA
jgi:2-amino-4,5-dihydroxy-6-oxo-7-(phosphonooxy)heptanoate synthase